MGKDYQLFISFPRSYSNENATTYPVLYVVDGRQHFELFKSAYRYMNYQNELEDLIIVGIGSGNDYISWIINRTYEFNPYLDTTLEKNWDNRLGVPSGTTKLGGAAKFLECIKTEIVPFIEKNYKANSDRGLWGMSYGGTFASYSLANSSNFFYRYGIHSPDYLRENEKIMDQIIAQFERDESRVNSPNKVYFSVGGLDLPDYENQLTKLCKTLESKNYKNTNWSWRVFEGETHTSVVPGNISRTITELYRKK